MDHLQAAVAAHIPKGPLLFSIQVKRRMKNAQLSPNFLVTVDKAHPVKHQI
jgi:hypothetical protein